MTHKINRVIIDEKIMSGKPVIKGTRVPIYVILGSLAAGMDYMEIIKEYGIAMEDILSCLRYAADVINSEAVYPLNK